MRLDKLLAHHHVSRRDATPAEMGRRNKAQDFFHRIFNQRWVAAQLLQLIGVLQQRHDAKRYGGGSRVLTGDQHETRQFHDVFARQISGAHLLHDQAAQQIIERILVLAIEKSCGVVVQILARGSRRIGGHLGRQA